ncbi:MAG: hypothetical protein WC111_01780 [Candidatus Cloacimonadaceae bacterium]|jgi:hypothetical protein|nr:hypothetical protein [Candidatus Cloacimonadota bacterium]MCB5259347.1 hypothetical protein [Candidatus Cloacimonadota bacterium]MDD3524885.1 hypothetical protein [Candidatus Cloacimonadota bacterium]
MPPINKPTYPANMTEGDLRFEALVDVMVADKIYLGSGTYTASEIANVYATQDSIQDHLGLSFDPLGELAEKPGKADSKITKLKTRNYAIPGKRTSTVELTISGLSVKQKDYLESSFFMGKSMTIVVTSTSLDRVVVFNGLRWTVDWSGEADGLFSVVISTEFSGITAGKLYLFKDIPLGP